MIQYMQFQSVESISKDSHEFTSNVRITKANDQVIYYFKEEKEQEIVFMKLVFKQGEIMLERKSNYSSSLILQENKRIDNTYETEYGTIIVGTKLNYFEVSDSYCQVNYDVFQDDVCVGKFNVTLKSIH